MIIKVLGPGCAKCAALERRTREAVEALGVDTTIEKIDDYPTIVGYGVTATPALVVDEKVVISGRVPTVAWIRDVLSRHAPVAQHDGS
jgi:small redox-active disulfide protein 2